LVEKRRKFWYKFSGEFSGHAMSAWYGDSPTIFLTWWDH